VGHLDAKPTNTRKVETTRGITFPGWGKEDYIETPKKRDLQTAKKTNGERKDQRKDLKNLGQIFRDHLLKSDRKGKKINGKSNGSTRKSLRGPRTSTGSWRLVRHNRSEGHS